MAYPEITLAVDTADRPADADVYQFTKDVVGGLAPLLQAEPEVRIYDVA